MMDSYNSFVLSARWGEGGGRGPEEGGGVGFFCVLKIIHVHNFPLKGQCHMIEFVKKNLF